jgi:hypothetical protein
MYFVPALVVMGYAYRDEVVGVFVRFRAPLAANGGIAFDSFNEE